MEDKTGGTAMKTALGLLAACLVCSGASAQELEIAIGESLYSYYCATCHGETAKGDGPMTQYLNVKVPDLTGLSQRNGGQFPMLSVIHMIDGRDRKSAHGGAMPVFSALFAGEIAGYLDDATAVIEAQGRIMTLALYLESIQK
jgi:mono/diheme cytochrome c family protein